MEKQIKSKNTFGKLIGIIYARYSSDNQREESIEGQIRECKEYAEKNNIVIIDTYIDRALTATSDKRPEFQRMIRDSAKGIFNTVLVWKLDRFSRDRVDSALYKNTLKKNGVKVISAKENISDGSAGILLESMLEGYAEYYSAELSEKVKRGLKENALKTRANGGITPFGYRVDSNRQYQIEPTNAVIVEEIFNLYANGMKMKELSKLLTQRGIFSSTKNKFSINALQRLLTNRKYIGEYKFSDVTIPEGIPAIVTKELFEKVQMMLVRNKRQPSRHTNEDDYLLTTKLFCSKCGALMSGESGTSKTGAKHRYYKCYGVRKKCCDKKNIKKNVVEDIILNETIKLLANENVLTCLIDDIYKSQLQENNKLPYLKDQLKDVEKRINNLISAIEQGITSETTRLRLIELEETKSKIYISIYEEEIKKPILSKEQIGIGICRFLNLDISDRYSIDFLIHNFINAVYVYDDKLEILLNYKENTNIINLNELKSSCPNTVSAPLIKHPHFIAKKVGFFFFLWKMKIFFQN